MHRMREALYAHNGASIVTTNGVTRAESYVDALDRNNAEEPRDVRDIRYGIEIGPNLVKRGIVRRYFRPAVTSIGVNFTL